jgi:hypothetical protein
LCVSTSSSSSRHLAPVGFAVEGVAEIAFDHRKDRVDPPTRIGKRQREEKPEGGKRNRCDVAWRGQRRCIYSFSITGDQPMTISDPPQVDPATRNRPAPAPEVRPRPPEGRSRTRPGQPKPRRKRCQPARGGYPDVSEPLIPVCEQRINVRTRRMTCFPPRKTGSGRRITSFKPRKTGFGSRITGSRLRRTCCEPRITCSPSRKTCSGRRMTGFEPWKTRSGGRKNHWERRITCSVWWIPVWA